MVFEYLENNLIKKLTIFVNLILNNLNKIHIYEFIIHNFVKLKAFI